MFAQEYLGKRGMVYSLSDHVSQRLISPIRKSLWLFEQRVPARFAPARLDGVNCQARNEISKEYARFSADIPAMCRTKHLDPAELTFQDFCKLAAEWIVFVIPGKE